MQRWGCEYITCFTIPHLKEEIDYFTCRTEILSSMTKCGWAVIVLAGDDEPKIISDANLQFCLKTAEREHFKVMM